MERVDLAKMIFKQGYLAMIEQLLEKAVKLLQSDAS